VHVDPLELLVVPVVVVPELVEPVVVVPELLELVDPPQGPHTPSALPMGTMHVSPGQQSALTVHLPHVGTQVPPV
jgi:hypothetical protein